MKTLHGNGLNSPNRSTCNVCGSHIDSFENLCPICKRNEESLKSLKAMKASLLRFLAKGK